MNVSNARRLSSAFELAIDEFGPDATLRQVQTLLVIAMAGPSGIDGATMTNRLKASQAGTSRHLKWLVVKHGMADYFLDPNDGRFRLTRLTSKGAKFVEKLLGTIDK